MNTLRKFGQGLLVLTLSLAGISALGQQQAPQTADSVGGTWASAASYAVISANGSPDGGRTLGLPLVTFISAASDLAGSKLQFYTVSSPVVITNANTTTSIPVTITNGFASGDIVVIRHSATDTYERRVLTTMTTSNVLNVTVAPTTATAAGDLIYDAQTAGAIPWGASTNYIASAAGLWAGQPGRPLLVDLTGTASCAVWAVSAVYK